MIRGLQTIFFLRETLPRVLRFGVERGL